MPNARGGPVKRWAEGPGAIPHLPQPGSCWLRAEGGARACSRPAHVARGRGAQAGPPSRLGLGEHPVPQKETKSPVFPQDNGREEHGCSEASSRLNLSIWSHWLANGHSFPIQRGPSPSRGVIREVPFCALGRLGIQLQKQCQEAGRDARGSLPSSCP